MDGQISLFECTDTSWTDKIQTMLADLIEKHDLPKESLFQIQKSRVTKKRLLVRCKIYLWEQSYPAVTNEPVTLDNLLATIEDKQGKKSSDPDYICITVKKEIEDNLRSYLPSDAEVMKRTKTDKDNGVIKVRFFQASDAFYAYVRNILAHCIKTFRSKSPKFGCCHLYVECSDAGNCLHVNKLYSTACMYRKNLENGRIFYGKNKNI